MVTAAAPAGVNSGGGMVQRESESIVMRVVQVPLDLPVMRMGVRLRGVWLALVFEAAALGGDSVTITRAREIGVHARDINALESAGMIKRVRRGRFVHVQLPIDCTSTRMIHAPQGSAIGAPIGVSRTNGAPPWSAIGAPLVRVADSRRRSEPQRANLSAAQASRARANPPSGGLTRAPGGARAYARHPFADDGSGTCAVCPLPPGHVVHRHPRPTTSEE